MNRNVCPNCGRENGMENQFCMCCGTQLPNCANQNPYYQGTDIIRRRHMDTHRKTRLQVSLLLHGFSPFLFRLLRGFAAVLLSAKQTNRVRKGLLYRI